MALIDKHFFSYIRLFMIEPPFLLNCEQFLEIIKCWYRSLEYLEKKTRMFYMRKVRDSES